MNRHHHMRPWKILSGNRNGILSMITKTAHTHTTKVTRVTTIFNHTSKPDESVTPHKIRVIHSVSSTNTFLLLFIREKRGFRRLKKEESFNSPLRSNSNQLRTRRQFHTWSSISAHSVHTQRTLEVDAFFFPPHLSSVDQVSVHSISLSQNSEER